ncbi:hypothetical protein ITJ64_17685 [Herbiconiux sp. VKM Ac-1786]|uniref:hypothetical protein n=1 Tax=Herbiconiux sp. VKM Ac-1786 TaxID=2783824 RepID=UPI00188A3724|nr:hypothetical protein [Herbiconiux sp. VKM Ac-1786]MBF4574346.1 hypothetical protein [Herbiconiux sp. VKM Ac-1786]
MDTDEQNTDERNTDELPSTEELSRAGIAPGVGQGGSPELPAERGYSIHDQDAGELTEPRSAQQIAEELAADGKEQVVAPGADAAGRQAGTRSPSGGDDAVAGDGA